MGDEVKKSEVQSPKSEVRARWFIIAVSAVAVLGFGIWGLGFAFPKEDEVWKRILARGVFTVATDASYPPFSAVDADGNLFGFDIDLAEAIGREWGVRVEFENIAYDALLDTLISERDDAVISAFVPQPERTKQILFSGSYFVGGTVAVIKLETGTTLKGNPVLWASGKTLAVEYGAGGDAIARQWKQRTPDITILPKPTADEALLSVENDQAQAALVDAISAYSFLRDRPTLALAGPPLEPEPYAIAVSARSRTLHQQVEQALAALETDGTLAELKVKWFGAAASEK
jgi:ABC-type amino acid transport substrate-binding protein